MTIFASYKEGNSNSSSSSNNSKSNSKSKSSICFSSSVL